MTRSYQKGFYTAMLLGSLFFLAAVALSGCGVRGGVYGPIGSMDASVDTHPARPLP
jgi:predicted small lipoprotein YifL